MSESINISMLLYRTWRTPEGLSRVQSLASTLGIELTTSGKTSLSGKVSPERFKELFGHEPAAVAPAPPSQSDFGTPGGYDSEAELAVPAELAEFVEIISVMPPATRLH